MTAITAPHGRKIFRLSERGEQSRVQITCDAQVTGCRVSHTVTDRGYCFAHRGRATFTVTHHGDGQETTTCRRCGAQGYGPAITPQS